MSWKNCRFCGTEMTGAGLDSNRTECMKCWELFVEEGGPQYDPKNHPRATEYNGE